jgi:hypothetical protein
VYGRVFRISGGLMTSFSLLGPMTLLLSELSHDEVPIFQKPFLPFSALWIRRQPIQSQTIPAVVKRAFVHNADLAKHAASRVNNGGWHPVVCGMWYAVAVQCISCLFRREV